MLVNGNAHFLARTSGVTVVIDNILSVSETNIATPFTISPFQVVFLSTAITASLPIVGYIVVHGVIKRCVFAIHITTTGSRQYNLVLTAWTFAIALPWLTLPATFRVDLHTRSVGRTASSLVVIVVIRAVSIV